MTKTTNRYRIFDRLKLMVLCGCLSEPLAFLIVVLMWLPVAWCIAWGFIGLQMAFGK